MQNLYLTEDVYVDYIKNSKCNKKTNYPVFKMGKIFEHTLHHRRQMNGK